MPEDIKAQGFNFWPERKGRFSNQKAGEEPAVRALPAETERWFARPCKETPALLGGLAGLPLLLKGPPGGT